MRIVISFFLYFSLVTSCQAIKCDIERGSCIDLRDTVKVAYVIESTMSENEVSETAKFINRGEYALILPSTLIKKDDNDNTIVVENSVNKIIEHKYEYCERVGTVETVDGSVRLVFEPQGNENGFPIDLEFVEEEMAFYDIEDWPFYVVNEEGIYPQLFLCYEFLDSLVKNYPDLITKYDPMATYEYIENGIIIKPLPNINDSLHNVGYTEWPIYMTGIEEGSYSFNGYTKSLLHTPSYKTFVYAVRDNDKVGANTKRQFFIQSGIHSAEVMSQIGTCLFVESLLSGSINSSRLLTHFDFWIVPCLEGYGGMHGDSWTAATINANRNYITPWWRFNLTQLYNCGYEPGDQFSTRLSMALMDYISPDIFLDVHTLNDLLTVPSTSTITVEFLTSFSYELCKYASRAADKVLQGIYEKFHYLFNDVSPRAVIGYDYPNSATGRSYMAYKHNDATVALVEVNNTLAGNNSTLNSSEALTIAAYFIKCIVYELCAFNLSHCNSVS